MKYDDMWSNVCYESDTGTHGDRWSFANAGVVCKELGFPGTMYARQGGQGNGTRSKIILGYKCRQGNKFLVFKNISSTFVPFLRITLKRLNCLKKQTNKQKTNKQRNKTKSLSF